MAATAPSVFSKMANRAWRLKRYPVGLPTVDDFELVAAEPPSSVLADGEVLLRTAFISVDPYMRTRMKAGAGYLMDGFELGGKPIDGFIVATVEQVAQGDGGDGGDRLAGGLAVGDYVHGFLPWRELNVASASALSRIDSSRSRSTPADGTAAADLMSIPPSAYLGVLGLTGLSAYFPCLEIGQPKAGETAFVSAAAGAVGSIAGQVFKQMGCEVYGSAGTPEKLAALRDELGFDGALNYKVSAEELDAQLGALCPKGIDIYFDNVGGVMLDTVLKHMNTDGRIISCGAISQYSSNADEAYGVKNLFMVVAKQLTIRGFLLHRWKSRFPEGKAQLAEWMREGKIAHKETIVDGFENVAEAMVSLLNGGNTGKLVVRVE